MSQMRRDKTLEELWNTAPSSGGEFDPRSITHLPPAAQRYLQHALAPGARLATAARLTMTGSIKLGQGWYAFKAEQVLRWDRGFVWSARAQVKGLPVTGFDRLVDGEGAMRWRLLGLFTVMKADGPDIARAAAGRLHAEAVWLPAALLGADVSWIETAPTHAVAVIDAHGERSTLDIAIDDTGAVRSCSVQRWGDMNTGRFSYHHFGGTAAAERTFDGVTIPVHLHVGWWFNTPRFEDEGEFFRCVLEDVRFR